MDSLNNYYDHLQQIAPRDLSRTHADHVGVIQGSRLLPLSDSSTSKGIRALPNLCIQWQTFWNRTVETLKTSVAARRWERMDGEESTGQWDLYTVMAGGGCLVAQSCPTLLQPHGQYVARQTPLSTRFPRQEFWSELSFPSPQDLPHQGIKLVSLALTDGVFSTEPPGKSQITAGTCHYALHKRIKCTPPRVNPSVNYGLRVMTMCPYTTN